jgi:ribosomal protein L24
MESTRRSKYQYIVAAALQLTQWFQKGHEAEVVSILKRRGDYLASEGRTPLVHSAFIAPLDPAAVFVRASTKDNIIHECQQISSARANRNNISSVPEEELEALTRVPKQFIPEDWVRFAKGIHRGDVALVTEVDADNRTCSAFYVPRLKLDGEGKSTSRRGRKVRPQQALFDPTVVNSAGGWGKLYAINNQDKIYRYRGHTYNRGLREEKGIRLDKFIQTPITPTYDELYMFQKSGILDIGLYSRALRDIMAHSLKEGWKVTVIAGQQKGLKGTVKEVVDQNTIRVEFAIDNYTSTSTVDVLKKYVKISNYEMGDSVKVVQGDKLGVDGLVVEATEEVVIIYDGKAKQTV